MHSIRRDLLMRLLTPLLVIMIVAGGSAYFLARYFSGKVLDHWLYDSGISLGNRVRWDEGRVTVDLPDGVREMLEWDAVDRVYYEVVSQRGERLVGNASLTAPPVAPDPEHKAVYYDSHVGEARVRVVAILVNAPSHEPVIVKVAETRLKRRTLAAQVLWISLGMSFLLTTLSAAVIWYAIGRGMAAIERKVRQIRSMHAAQPLSPIPLDDTLPSEVVPLVHEINDLIRNLCATHTLNERFIADAAHQLRTPLATLRVQLEVALREKDPERHLQSINAAVDVLTRMGRTLHQLLTLAKADEAEASMSSPDSVIDIDLIAREEVERRVDDAVAAGIDLGYAGTGRPVLVRGVDQLVREALANLLDNALRYSGAGAHVTVGVNANAPELYVEDDGPGIPAMEQSKVTQRFYRIPGASGDGCGLGLSVVTGIIKRHGGKLVLDVPSAGAGLRARLVFPGMQSSEPAAAGVAA